MRRHAVALVLAAIALAVGFTVVAPSASATTGAPQTSGTKCANPYALFGTQYHICAVVHGTARQVDYVNATLDTGNGHTCGYFLVATPYGNRYSARGCPSFNTGPFHATIIVNIRYSQPGPLNVWWVTTSGDIYKYPDGFWIS